MKNIVKIDQKAFNEQVQYELRINSIPIQSFQQFSKYRLEVFRRGCHAMEKQANSLFGTLPKYFWSSFSPEDAGVGYSLQRAIYYALDGRVWGEEMGILGTFYNAIIGLIDRFTDEFTNYLPIIQESLNKHTLTVLLQGQESDLLPRPTQISGTEAFARIELLLQCIEVYVKQARALAIQSLRKDVWNTFCDIYFELMRHQFASATLTENSCEVSQTTMEIAVGRTAPTLWAYFVNAWLAGDTRDAVQRELYREAVQAWGEAIVLSEDLCDLQLDVSEGRWNTVTLLAVLDYHVSLTADDLQEHPEEVLRLLLEKHIPALITRRMCRCYRSAFMLLHKITPLNFDKLREREQGILCYPLFAGHMKRLQAPSF